MKIGWMLLVAALGAAMGAVIGFGTALAVASLAKSPNDGTYGLREMIICVPAGIVLGLIAGLAWSFRFG